MEVRWLQQVLAAATFISRPVANCCFFLEHFTTIAISASM